MNDRTAVPLKEDAREERPEDAGPAQRMDRLRLARELALQETYCASRSPLYSAVLRELSADAARSAPWARCAERAWRNRTFAVGWEAAHLLLACMHLWALRGSAPELAALYPSCGGSVGEPRGAARSFLRQAPPEFWSKLGSSLVQTNEVGRSVPWMLAAAVAFHARGMPFHLVELGASGGLNLIGDHLPHDCAFVSEGGGPAGPPAGWESLSPAVLSRTGLDLRPRRLSNPADRLWLKSCVWADDTARLERLERTVGLYLRLEKEARGPRLERRSFLEAPGWLEEKRPARPGEGLLVFNSIATVYMADEEYSALRRGMARALAPWGDRGFWVEFERPRGREGPLELAVHRVLGGELRTKVLASGPPRPKVMRLKPGWEFLSA